MPDLIQKALTAKRESKSVEFKETFDPTSPGDWCEVVKDIVAIANSGGGIIVFGVDSSGVPTGTSLLALAQTDPADVGNKVSKYTGPVQLDFEMRELKKQGKKLQAVIVQAAPIPIIFQKPGTYEVAPGKQKTAFGVGTVYFRHGAKSEPGNSEGIRAVIERQLEFIRKSWIKGVRRVVQAQEGSQIIAVPPSGTGGPSSLATTVRAVNDPRATPVLLTRDATKTTTGTFVHEEVSDAIFDEINNVIDANRVLAKGQRRFFLGLPVYYRIYAERQHVSQSEEHTTVLLHSAVCDLYAPALFWAVTLPAKTVASTFAELYLQPRSPGIRSLIRMALLLGEEFREWLFERWQRKWKHYAQPPNFYWTFTEARSKLAHVDPRIVAANVSKNTVFQVSGNPPIEAIKLLDSPQLASSLLSTACMRVFQGDADMRSAARNLDYFAYGPQVSDSAAEISKSIMKLVGDREVGDFGDATTEEQ